MGVLVLVHRNGYAAAAKPANYINHIALVLDASSSMYPLNRDVVKVAELQVQHLAQLSRDLDQETRITVYTFSYRSEIHCLIYEIDVLRMPSIAGLYEASGQTALIDATVLAIDELSHLGGSREHSFLI